MSIRSYVAVPVGVLLVVGAVLGSADLSEAADRATTSAPEQASRSRERAHLLRQGEAALAVGKAEIAQSAFDQAAALSHAADTELGLVRTYMQAGEYRRALSFVAHTAQAHRDGPDAALLYAWLLRIGGHGADAKRVLSDAEAAFPKHALLQLTRSQLDSPRPIASGSLLKPPARMAPYGPIAGLAADARVIGTGVLIDDGKRVVMPRSLIGKSRVLWIRDGIGRSSRVTVDPSDSGEHLAIARLASPIGGLPGMNLVSNDPFPGSVAFYIEYATSTTATPSWPLLTTGFIAHAAVSAPDRAVRTFDAELPAGPRGGTVFDIDGRWAGIAMPNSAGRSEITSVAHLRKVLGVPAAPQTQSLTQRIPVNQIYEIALRTTVQIIGAP